jgi:hypothetical protein
VPAVVIVVWHRRGRLFWANDSGGPIASDRHDHSITGIEEVLNEWQRLERFQEQRVF